MELNTRQGHMRKRDQFDGPLDFLAGETGRARDFVTSENQEWFLEAKAVVTFWANKSQFNSAKEIARRALLARIYQGLHVELRNLRLAISNGDRGEAFEVADRMQRVIEG